MRTHTESRENKDSIYRDSLIPIESNYQIKCETFGSIDVLTDLALYGTKSRMSDKLAEDAATAGYKYLTYRMSSGAAGAAITTSAKKYGLKTRLFWFASKKPPTADQLHCYSLGAELHYQRASAASHLNKLQRVWCESNNGVLIPLGLPSLQTTSAIVSAFRSVLQQYDIICSVAGSGTLTRGLQLAAPNKLHFISPVSRNIKKGERGIAEIIDYQQPFEEAATIPAPFDCMSHYDAKAWRLALDVREKYPKAKICIINVCKDIQRGDLSQYSGIRGGCGLPWGKISVYSKERGEECFLY